MYDSMRTDRPRGWRRLGGSAAALLCAGALGGCSWFGTGTGAGAGSALALAEVAAAAAEYEAQSVVAAMGRLEVADLESSGAQAAGAATQGFAAAALIIDEEVHVLPDGTAVTIVRILDDRDTADPQDDRLTVSRSFEMWAGATKVQQIERPRPPEAWWSGWVDDELQQAGTIDVYVEGILVEQGTVQVTWRRSGEQVSVAAIDQLLTSIDAGGAVVRTVIEVDADGLHDKTVYRIRVVDGAQIIVHSFSFEQVDVGGGVLRTKILRDDGRYAIVEHERQPRVVAHYSADGVLRARVNTVHDRGTGQRFIRRELFDAGGAVIAVHELVVTIRLLGDQVVVTKTFASGRTVEVVIGEQDDGYVVQRDGVSYLVRFPHSGQVDLLSLDGMLIASVVFEDDGTVTVVYPDGASDSLTL